ncbi:MAG: hypothetical protein ACFFD2_30860, partial [Promethearchaeota archaeon]
MTQLDARKALDAIKALVLPAIQPTQEENQIINQIYTSLERNLQLIAEKLNIKPKFIQNHGSTGIKKTHLHGTSDLDIFIGLNPREYSIIELSPKKRRETLKKLFHSYVQEWFIPAARAAGYMSFQISYAEHPYLIISHNNYEIDIVGCF